MPRIDGIVMHGNGNPTNQRGSYIDYEFISQSLINNTITINVKSYYSILSGITSFTIPTRTAILRYDEANERTNVVNSFVEGPIGTIKLMSETNYTIPYTPNGKSKTISLYAYSLLLGPDTPIHYMEVSGNVILPKISNGNIKISEVWKQAFCWRKISGVWKRCWIWRKINGVWKKGI